MMGRHSKRSLTQLVISIGAIALAVVIGIMAIALLFSWMITEYHW